MVGAKIQLIFTIGLRLRVGVETSGPAYSRYTYTLVSQFDPVTDPRIYLTHPKFSIIERFRTAVRLDVERFFSETY